MCFARPAKNRYTAHIIRIIHFIIFVFLVIKCKHYTTFILSSRFNALTKGDKPKPLHIVGIRLHTSVLLLKAIVKTLP